MTDSTVLEGGRETVRGEITRILRHHSEPLPAPERAEEFALFFDRFGDARVVLIGEATHGTSEFYRARAAITERLISRHGFAFVAVEADWPDAARVDRYVRHGEVLSGGGEPFARFPTWMWRNAEVRAFADWLSSNLIGLINRKGPHATRVRTLCRRDRRSQPSSAMGSRASS